ncbi:succinate dehydrogenase, cytochrome b556 subunit [Sphingosinithalassobacter tenebrarum]|uniref:Succinate dehydrogenase cytochrome b556 subunit n=2 Tax=Stakelama tenebrarum TaxID=2711215 RepID=A0A6G6Y982_9SPHN|nr:succinate dehydrogenase, cytochrome b556 subunit [Sphingosinithalassobacter tenebrarum]QIG81494.1 succinate dehydrogenase, cytochrome b556 subunit [Sphingosinithalassobacter tenebrarum]
MANVSKSARPLSPHLSIWKWGPHMAVSIVHRATGSGLATVGTILFVWWLAAAAGGPDSYAAFVNVFTLESGGLNVLGWILGLGLTLSVFQHMMSGVRHLFLDQGANFELKGNRTTALLTFFCSLVLTLAFWFFMLEKFNG